MARRFTIAQARLGRQLLTIMMAGSATTKPSKTSVSKVGELRKGSLGIWSPEAESRNKLIDLDRPLQCLKHECHDNSKMRLLTHKILTLTPSILSEGPLIKGSIPIGRFQNAGPILSRSFSAYAQQAGNNATRVKRWQSDVYKSANFRRRGSSTRSKSAWEQQSIGPATSPKRSNAAPLLGVLFGASALAFLGSSIVSNVDDVQVDPIKPSENVDLEDTEGTSLGT